MKLYNKTLLFVLVLTTLAACKTAKHIPLEIAGKNTPVLDKSHSLTPAEMVAQIQKNQPAFTTARVTKMSVKADFKGRQMDVRATCSIVSDSAIHLSVQPFFGVELFKLELTPATLILIDKANRRFYESNYGIFRNLFGVTVNYDGIQSLISNRLFVAGKKAFIPDDFSWKNKLQGDTLYLQFETMNQETILNLTLARIAEVILKTNDNAYVMKTTYSEFKDFDGMLFPENIHIEASKEKTTTSFHFKIEDAKFNIPLSLEPTNLLRYTRGDINTFFTK